jgi:hypothetical protein
LVHILVSGVALFVQRSGYFTACCKEFARFIENSPEGGRLLLPSVFEELETDERFGEITARFFQGLYDACPCDAADALFLLLLKAQKPGSAFPLRWEVLIAGDGSAVSMRRACLEDAWFKKAAVAFAGGTPISCSPCVDGYMFMLITQLRIMTATLDQKEARAVVKRKQLRHQLDYSRAHAVVTVAVGGFAAAEERPASPIPLFLPLSSGGKRRRVAVEDCMSGSAGVDVSSGAEALPMLVEASDELLDTLYALMHVLRDFQNAAEHVLRAAKAAGLGAASSVVSQRPGTQSAAKLTVQGLEQFKCSCNYRVYAIMRVLSVYGIHDATVEYWERKARVLKRVEVSEAAVAAMRLGSSTQGRIPYNGAHLCIAYLWKAITIDSTRIICGRFGHGMCL